MHEGRAVGGEIEVDAQNPIHAYDGRDEDGFGSRPLCQNDSMGNESGKPCLFPSLLKLFERFRDGSLHHDGIEFESIGKCAFQSLRMIESAIADLIEPTKALGEVAVAQASDEIGLR